LGKKAINIVKYLLFFLIGFGLLWLVTKDKDLSKLFSYFKSANYWWVLLSLATGILSHFIRAIRWNILIEETGYKPKPASTFYAVMIGYLANLAIPRIGEVTRCGVLSKAKKMPMGMLLGTVISERVFDLLTLISLMIITIAIQFDKLKQFLDHYLFSPIGAKFDNSVSTFLLGAIILIGAIALFFAAYRFLLFPLLKSSKFYFKYKRLLVSFKSGLKAIIYNKKKWLFLLYTIILWILYTLMIFFCVFALNDTAHLTIFDSLTIMVLGSIGIVAPVPGGIGAYHFIVIALLTEIYAIVDEAATSFAYIAHTSQMAIIILVGTFSYFMLLLIQKKK
jgi:uncharacterized protein (TIRG00374 family)